MLYTILFFIGCFVYVSVKYPKIFNFLCNFTYKWILKLFEKIEISKFNQKYLEINFKEGQNIQKICIIPNKISGIYKIEVLADGSKFPLWTNHNKILKCTYYLGLPLTPLSLDINCLEITLTSIPIKGNPICIKFEGNQSIDLQKELDKIIKIIETSVNEEVYD